MNTAQLDNYFIDCLGYSQEDCNDMKKYEKNQILEEVGETFEALEYNNLV